MCEGEHVVLYVKSTKTIQFNERELSLPLPTVPNHVLCPVTALRHAFSMGPVLPGETPLFSYYSPSGIVSISYQRYVKDLRLLLSRLGLPETQYAGHSLRRGGGVFRSSSGGSIRYDKTHG